MRNECPECGLPVNGGWKGTCDSCRDEARYQREMAVDFEERSTQLASWTEYCSTHEEEF